jgi:hypothetical protein
LHCSVEAEEKKAIDHKTLSRMYEKLAADGLIQLLNVSIPLAAGGQRRELLLLTPTQRVNDPETLRAALEFATARHKQHRMSASAVTSAKVKAAAERRRKEKAESGQKRKRESDAGSEAAAAAASAAAGQSVAASPDRSVPTVARAAATAESELEAPSRQPPAKRLKYEKEPEAAAASTFVSSTPSAAIAAAAAAAAAAVAPPVSTPVIPDTSEAEVDNGTTSFFFLSLAPCSLLYVLSMCFL